MSYYLTITTCPDKESAESLAYILVENGLAACVSIIPGVTSVYEWQGEINKGQECILLIKTRADIYEDLESTIRSEHPYELPEIIAVPIERGLSTYLSWLDSVLDKQ